MFARFARLKDAAQSLQFQVVFNLTGKCSHSILLQQHHHIIDSGMSPSRLSFNINTGAKAMSTSASSEWSSSSSNIPESNIINTRKRITTPAVASVYHRSQFNQHASFPPLLWEAYAQRFKFLKMHLPASAERDIHKRIEAATSHLHRNDWRFVVQEWKLEDGSSDVILANVPFEFGRMFASRDLLEHDRFFIGLEMQYGSYTSTAMTGMIVYFDKDGKQFGKRVSTLNVAEYDWRDGTPVVFLRSQSLVLLQAHRDWGFLHIFVNKLDKKDDVVQSCNYRSNFAFHHHGNVSDHVSIVGGRFLLMKNLRVEMMPVDIKSKLTKQVALDLGSFGSEGVQAVNSAANDAVDVLFLHEYDVPVGQEDQLAAMMAAQYNSESDVLSANENFGYPKRCPKCNGATKIVGINYRSTSGGFGTQSCGSGYCTACNIRFSLSYNSWICMQFVKPMPSGLVSPCGAELTADSKYECCKQHHPMNYKLSKPEHLPAPDHRRVSYMLFAVAQDYPSK